MNEMSASVKLMYFYKLNYRSIWTKIIIDDVTLLHWSLGDSVNSFAPETTDNMAEILLGHMIEEHDKTC